MDGHGALYTCMYLHIHNGCPLVYCHDLKTLEVPQSISVSFEVYRNCPEHISCLLYMTYMFIGI